MKFRCPKEVLVRGVTAVQGAVGSSYVSPALEDICMTAYPDGKIEFLATNLHLAIRCIRECDVEVSGAIRVPSKVFIQLVKDLPIGEATIECVEDRMTISSGKFKGKLSGADAGAFPDARPVIDGTKSFMPVKTLRDLIHKTIFAATNEKARFELDGIKLVATDGMLDAVATDGRRLAWVRMPVEFSKMNLMLPSATARILRSILPEDGEAEIIDGGKHVTIHASDLEITSTLLTDKFPPYDKIFPKDESMLCFCLANRDDLAETIRRTANLTDLDSWRVSMVIGPDGMELNGENKKIGGKGHDALEIAEFTGERIEGHFNARYVLDLLKVCGSESVDIRLYNNLDRTGLSGANLAGMGVFSECGDTPARHVVMTLRLPEDNKEEGEA